MGEKFSMALRIGDLSDFIAPSQACVVSLKSTSAAIKKSQVTVDRDNKEEQAMDPVRISLKDCLACRLE